MFVCLRLGANLRLCLSANVRVYVYRVRVTMCVRVCVRVCVCVCVSERERARLQMQCWRGRRWRALGCFDCPALGSFGWPVRIVAGESGKGLDRMTVFLRSGRACCICCICCGCLRPQGAERPGRAYRDLCV